MLESYEKDYLHMCTEMQKSNKIKKKLRSQAKLHNT